jgi:hypothetical protein
MLQLVLFRVPASLLIFHFLLSLALRLYCIVTDGIIHIPEKRAIHVSCPTKKSLVNFQNHEAVSTPFSCPHALKQEQDFVFFTVQILSLTTRGLLSSFYHFVTLCWFCESTRDLRLASSLSCILQLKRKQILGLWDYTQYVLGM